MDLLTLPLVMLLMAFFTVVIWAGFPLIPYSSLIWVPFLQRRLYHSAIPYGQFLAVILVPIPGCVSLLVGKSLLNGMGDFDLSWKYLVCEYSGKGAWTLLEAVWIVLAIDLSLWALLERRFERAHNLSAPEERWSNTQTKHRLLCLALVSLVLTTFMATYTPLYKAVNVGDVSLAERRLRFNLEGMGPNDYLNDELFNSFLFRRSLLTLALFNHDKDMALLLMTHGANKDFDHIRYFDSDMGQEIEETYLVLETPIRRNDREMVEFMLDQGADANAQAGGYTPLHAAAAHGTAEIVELLIQRGANVMAKTNEGETPLDTAKANKNREATNVLLRRAEDHRQ